MEKTLTISIAAYNMEAYIGEGLASLVDERIIDELEIFVVDDGGTDRTLEIAREYAARYPQAIFPVHKENGGYGTTVNYSIEHATGKYFKVLDGDDWFDAEGLYRLVCELRTTDVDAVVTRVYQGTDENNLTESSEIGTWETGVTKIAELQGERPATMHHLTFKTEILKRIHLRLPGRIQYTDHYLVTKPFIAVETVKYLDVCVYCYRLGRDGQSVSRESRIRHIQEALTVAENLCRFYEENKDCPNRKYLCMSASMAAWFAYRTLLMYPVGRESLQRIREYERMLHSISPEVQRQIEETGRTGRFIGLMRRSHYLAYWLLKLIPEGREAKI